LDTRTKIIDEAAARQILSEQGLQLVQAELDPLDSRLATALESIGAPLLLQLRSRQNEYFSLPARAALAAGLRCVHYVVITESPLGDSLDLRPQEALWRAELEARALAKNKVS
jgi:hypothetical protein